MVRQYQKNVGRKLKVKSDDQTIEGKLEEANEDQIVLTWKVREPKPVGKGKVTVEKKAQLAYDDIQEAKVMITFSCPILCAHPIFFRILVTPYATRSNSGLTMQHSRN